MDELTWSWAVENVQVDVNQEAERVKGILDYITAWINPEMYKQLNKKHDEEAPLSSDYLETLRKMGASEEELKPVIEAYQKNSESTAEEESLDEFDEVKVLRAPPNGQPNI